MPQVINPPVLTPQPSIVNQELPVPVNSTSEVEQIKEQPPSNENNSNIPTQVLDNTNSQTSVFESTNQQLPYSSPSSSVPYFSPQITSFQNSTPAFHTTNCQYFPQQLEPTSDTMKPFVLTPHVTTLSSITSQESTSVSTSQVPVISTVCSPQTISAQENITYQSPAAFPPQSIYSQYHPADIGGTTTIADVQTSKEISNYFPQIQTQANPTNNSSSIPMFSVKNFPQMSPLAQPLGKIYEFIQYYW